ncbi:MAG: hypothetical protein ACPGVG_05805 [Mycobacterium sp.]
MNQVIINPPRHKVLPSKLYTAGTAELLESHGSTDISGGGWLVGISLLGGASNNFALLYDGANASAPLIMDVQPRTVVNYNLELPGENWRKFTDGIWLVLGAGVTRCVVYYLPRSYSVDF